MLIHVVCEACGEAGSLLIEDEGDLPNCPRCDGRLSVVSGQGEKPESRERDIDDDVVSWVAPPSDAPTPLSDREAACPSCGLAGVMWLDSYRGNSICPVCLAVYRTNPPASQRSVDCPGCGRAVEYSDLDRGKTVICGACKYFLGCLVPSEKHPYRARRRSGLR